MADYRRDLAQLDARTRAVALRMLVDALPPVESAPSEPPASGVVRRPTLLGVGVGEPPPAAPVNARVLAAAGLGPRPSGRDR